MRCIINVVINNYEFYESSVLLKIAICAHLINNADESIKALVAEPIITLLQNNVSSKMYIWSRLVIGDILQSV